MHTLQRIWKDIRQFENIDLYVTVLVGLGLAILNLLGVASSAYIAPLTLALLSLLAFTSLINRHGIQRLQDSLSNSATSIFLEEFPSDMKGKFDTAAEVWLIGVSLHRTINFNYARIEEKLRQGHRFKVMVVHPEGTGIEMAVSRNYARKEVAIKSADIRGNLQLLCDLKKIAPDRFDVRTIQNPLSYGVIAINPETASGIFYIEHYTFGISNEALPKFIIGAKDGQWYDFFRREIQALWAYGIEWVC